MASGETVQRPQFHRTPWTLLVVLLAILAFSGLCHGQTTAAPTVNVTTSNETKPAAGSAGNGTGGGASAGNSVPSTETPSVVNTTAAVSNAPTVVTSMPVVLANVTPNNNTGGVAGENVTDSNSTGAATQAPVVTTQTSSNNNTDNNAGNSSNNATTQAPDTNTTATNNNPDNAGANNTGNVTNDNNIVTQAPPGPTTAAPSGPCASNPCIHGNCSVADGGTFNCTCQNGWMGTTCAQDKNECAPGSSPCPDPNAHCINTEGSFNCTCNSGYKRLADGANCTDIDECLEGVCGPNRLLCMNTFGSYSCLCTTGWTGPKCSLDVDECASNTSCVDTNSVCKNTNGSFSCPCKTGFERVTANANCTGEVLLPYDKSLSSRLTGDDDIFGPFYVPEGFMMWGVPHVSYFVSINGYITFDTKLDQKFAPYMNSSALKDRTIIAPYWFDIEIPSQNMTTGLYHVELPLVDTLANNTLQLQFNEYKDWIVKKLTDKNFDPTYIAVWTWENVLPYRADNFKDKQAATFQVVLTTNGLESFAIISYRSAWPMDINVTVGGLLQSVSRKGAVSQSTWHPGERIPPHHFQNDTNASTNASTNAGCIRWVYQQDKTVVPSGAPCPCSANQAQVDILFSMNSTSNCATSKMWNSAGVKSICCYHNQSNMLVKSYQDAQAPFLPLMFKDVNITTKQQNGFQTCCGGSSNLCYRFYNVFSLGRCAAYTAPISALLWGDPHLSSLDGTEYSFNGLGEYVILQSSNASLEVQGRTTKLTGQNVTVFTAFAIRKEADSTVEVRLAGANHSKVLINGQTQNFTGGPVQENFTYVESLDSGKAALIIFTTGMSIKVTATTDRLSLNILVQPGQLSQAKGLLGYVDGNKDNDFTFRNGTQLTGSAVAQNIFQFGQSWLIQFENQSFFTYDSNSNFTTNQHPDFMPTFLPTTVNDVQLALNEKGKKEVGNALCGSSLACLQDFLVTGKNETALETKTTQDEVSQLQNVLAAKPPEFNSSQEIWNVSLSSGTFTYTVSVKPDAVERFPSVTVQQSGLNYTFTNGTRGTWQFTWFLNESDALVAPITRITFTAANAAGLTTEYTPIVILCACSQNSQCYQPSLPNFIQQHAITAGPSYIPQCQCEPGKGGRFCKEVVPVCETCYQNAACKPNATDAKYCQACPEGFTGDGIKCYEINECLMPGRCDQLCQNTIGNFTCSCKAGYRLEGLTTCKEIDECAEKTDNCSATQFCHNTPGSFYCVCRPGTGGPTCQTKVSHVYVGRIVFLDSQQLQQGWSDDLTLPSSSAFKVLAERVQKQVSAALTNGSVVVVDVTVIDFKHLALSSQRRRRSPETTQPMIQATFQVDVNASQSMSVLNRALATGFNPTCNEDLCTFGNVQALVGVSRNGSQFDANYDLCASDRHNNCHNPSTNCTSADGAFSCTCLPGFQRWDLSDIACEDIDECVKYNTTYNCGTADGKCHNTAGSYMCDCPTTQYWNGTKCEFYKCEADPYPCQNGAECVNIGETSEFACRCTYGWTGALCDQEDSEAKKMKATVIGLAAGLGAFCVVLIIIIIVICALRGRQKNRQSTYNGSYQIPRPHLKTDDGTEMSRQDSMHKYTDFRRSTTLDDDDLEGERGGKSGMQQYENPVFTREENKL